MKVYLSLLFAVILFILINSSSATAKEGGTLKLETRHNSVYYVYDSSNKLLSKEKSGRVVRLPAGTYTLKLHNTFQKLTIGEGDEISLRPGTVEVVGKLLSYEIYDEENKKLLWESTAMRTALFPGTYTVRFKGGRRKAILEDGQTITFPSSVLEAKFNGSTRKINLYDINSNAQFEGVFYTNMDTELFPGEYLLTSRKRYSDQKEIAPRKIHVQRGHNVIDLNTPPAPQRRLASLYVRDKCTDLGLVLTNLDYLAKKRHNAEEIWALFGDKNVRNELQTVSRVFFVTDSKSLDTMQMYFGDDKLPSLIEYSDGTVIELLEYSTTSAHISGVSAKITGPDGRSTSSMVKFKGEKGRELLNAQQGLKAYSDFQEQISLMISDGNNTIKKLAASDLLLKATESMAKSVSAFRNILGTAFGIEFVIYSPVMMVLEESGSGVTNKYSAMKHLFTEEPLCTFSEHFDDIENIDPSEIYLALVNLLAESTAQTNNDLITAVSNGDPHLYTYDKLSYDFQAVGEFLYSKSVRPEDNFEIQVRQQAHPSSDKIALTTAVTMNVGGDMVGLYPAAIYINGVVREIPRGDTELPNGGLIKKDNKDFTITWPQAAVMVKVNTTSDYGMLVRAYISYALSGKLIGLMGNADGEPENDLVTEDGSTLGVRPGFDDLYPRFADKWRVTDESSLFEYNSGESTATFTNRDFPSGIARVSDLPEEVKEMAEKTCQQAGITNPVVLDNCILDVGFTGDNGFASLPVELANSAIQFNEITQGESRSMGLMKFFMIFMVLVVLSTLFYRVLINKRKAV